MNDELVTAGIKQRYSLSMKRYRRRTAYLSHLMFIFETRHTCKTGNECGSENCESITAHQWKVIVAKQCNSRINVSYSTQEHK